MGSIRVKPLGEGVSFGARVAGITQQSLQDEAVRRQLNDLFQDRGLIVFEDVDPTPQMHVAISNVFGPLKDHPVAAVPRADQENMPGVIDMRCEPSRLPRRETAALVPSRFPVAGLPENPSSRLSIQKRHRTRDISSGAVAVTFPCVAGGLQELGAHQQ